MKKHVSCYAYSFCNRSLYQNGNIYNGAFNGGDYDSCIKNKTRTLDSYSRGIERDKAWWKKTVKRIQAEPKRNYDFEQKSQPKKEKSMLETIMLWEGLRNLSRPRPQPQPQLPNRRNTQCRTTYNNLYKGYETNCYEY